MTSLYHSTPFHQRTAAASQTGLWRHWSGYLVAEKYQPAEKAEYLAIRNSAGVWDTSPLYKYRIAGRHAERFLAGVLARDIRTVRPGQAQYTLWCDGDGFVLEDGVVFRRATDEFWLTTAEPNYAYFADLIGSLAVRIDDISETFGTLALQGPASREIVGAVAPGVDKLRYFHHVDAKVGGAPATISRTGFTGDLGYEIWVEAADALVVWDAVMDAGAGRGVVPVGQIAILMARIEAGLLLLDTDFSSSRFAWNDTDRSTPSELGLGWMLRGIDQDERPFVGRDALRRALAAGSLRWVTVGLVVDWEAHDHTYRDVGRLAPKDHRPVEYEMMLYDDARRRVGYTASFMYSPIMQRHIAMARVLPELSTPGSHVNIEVTVDHEYRMVPAEVTTLPHYNPPHKVA